MRDFNPGLKHVKHFVLVSSGKGGVGKSTVASNLAASFAQQGLSTGLLDADISGPSQAMMWSLPTNVPVEVSDDRTLSLPFLKHGVKISTLATRVTISQSVQWRGAMASMALINLLCHTAWGELDVLVVDMPPGTGDIQVSICQKLPNAAVVTVTTPQQVAVADTRRGMSMYRDQKLRLLGVVENMSTHICENCGHHNSIFGTQGAEQLCSEFGVPLLAQLPLDSAVRFQADAGAPLVIQCPEHPVSQIYNTISTTVWRSLNE